VKEFWKLVNIWRSYGEEFAVSFFFWFTYVIRKHDAKQLCTRWLKIKYPTRQYAISSNLKSDHLLWRYCILSGGVFYFEPPCRPRNKFSSLPQSATRWAHYYVHIAKLTAPSTTTATSAHVFSFILLFLNSFTLLLCVMLLHFNKYERYYGSGSARNSCNSGPSYASWADQRQRACFG